MRKLDINEQELTKDKRLSKCYIIIHFNFLIGNKLPLGHHPFSGEFSSVRE